MLFNAKHGLVAVLGLAHRSRRRIALGGVKVIQTQYDQVESLCPRTQLDCGFLFAFGSSVIRVPCSTVLPPIEICKYFCKGRSICTCCPWVVDAPDGLSNRTEEERGFHLDISMHGKCHRVYYKKQ